MIMIDYIEEISIGHRMKLFNILYNLRLELQVEDKWTSGLCHGIFKKTRGVVPTAVVMDFITLAFIRWPEGNRRSTSYPIRVKTFTGLDFAVTQYTIVMNNDHLDFLTRIKTYFLRVRFINKRKRLLDYMIKILAESIGERMQ